MSTHLVNVSVTASSSGASDNHIDLTHLITKHEVLIIKDERRDVEYLFERDQNNGRLTMRCDTPDFLGEC